MMAIEPNTSIILCAARDSKVSGSLSDPEPSAPLPIESDWAPIMEFTAADIFQHSPKIAEDDPSKKQPKR